MNRVRKTLFIMVLIAFAVAAVSCNKKDNTPAKENVKLPPEHAKAVEAIKKSFEESKKATAAKVNGATISMFDLVREMNTIGPEYIKPGQQKDPKVDEKVRKEALDRLIYRELAVQEAIRQGIQAPPQNIDQEIAKMKADLKTEDAYRQKLSSAGITEAELKKQIERSILVEMITEREIFDKVKVDPNQVRKTYEREKASYRGPSGQMTFEEARPRIEEKLMTPLVQKREDEWVAHLKKAARIEIAPAQAAKEIHSIN